MKSEHPYARIAITLPPEDLAAADRLAAALDRSRSWVIAEALRQFVAAQGAGPLPPLDASRRAQLQRDMALSPSQRVGEAERTQVLPLAPGEPRRFAHYDDFVAWRRAQKDR